MEWERIDECCRNTGVPVGCSGLSQPDRIVSARSGGPMLGLCAEWIEPIYECGRGNVLFSISKLEWAGIPYKVITLHFFNI